MRVVGYVRETPDPSTGTSAFAQQEVLRRHAADRGLLLVAVCQDLRQPGQPVQRDGFLSLLGVIAAGGVDAVLVPGLDTFSSDAIVQEIVLWDLRSRGVRVVSTESADLEVLDPGAKQQPSRMLIRDVLERVDEHTETLPPRDVGPHLSNGDVYIRLIESDERAGEGAPT